LFRGVKDKREKGPGDDDREGAKIVTSEEIRGGMRQLLLNPKRRGKGDSKEGGYQKKKRIMKREEKECWRKGLVHTCLWG